MDRNAANTPEDLKSLILNSREPVVFKNFLNWDLLRWDLEKWNQLLKGEPLLFRCGKNSFTQEPQWERSTRDVTSTFQDFLTFSKKDGDEWMYFDYKYLREWLSGIEEVHNAINWSIFGFPELSFSDSTIWIGSKGAHTPCHIDTYGCNLIAQIYGKKQWLVFPPEEDLKPTRIPYEESSIYSKLNFFSPTPDKFEGVGNCRKIVLNPGDVLLLPHKWWHYVENLETAISINVWIPLPQDDLQRLSESLVQFLMSQITREIGEEAKKIVLNPSSDNEIAATDFTKSLSLINTCKTFCKSFNNKLQGNCDRKSQERSAILDKYEWLSTIPKLSEEEFKELINKQSSRFTQRQLEDCGNSEIMNLINALTHPDVISVMTDKLLNSV